MEDNGHLHLTPAGPAALLLSPPATGGTGGWKRPHGEPGLCAALRAALGLMVLA